MKENPTLVIKEIERMAYNQGGKKLKETDPEITQILELISNKDFKTYQELSAKKKHKR